MADDESGPKKSHAKDVGRRSVISGGATAAFLTSIGMGVGAGADEIWHAFHAQEATLTPVATRVAARIAGRAMTMLKQRDLMVTQKSVSPDAEIYNLEMKDIITDMHGMQRSSLPEPHKKTIEDIVMNALVPVLSYAVETGAGYFVTQIVTQYPRFKTETIVADDKPPFNLMKAIAENYAKSNGSKPDAEFATAEELMKAVETISLPPHRSPER